VHRKKNGEKMETHINKIVEGRDRKRRTRNKDKRINRVKERK
jgi:hypothetical protein